MKIIYEANDGTKFDTSEECIEHEESGWLLTHISENISETYCSDAGFSIIEETDVENYIRNNITEINRILGIRVVQ